LLDDLNVCDDERYLTLTEIEPLKREGWRVHKLVNGYIRFLRSVFFVAALPVSRRVFAKVPMTK
jgi:hypothetical protein